MNPLPPQHKKTLYQGAILVLVLSLCALFITLRPEKESEVVITDGSPEQIQEEKNPFGDIFIEAKSAYVLDVTTGKVLFQKNAETQLPLASVAKVMVALTAKRVIPDYMLISITGNDLLEEGDSGLLVGEQWRLSKLLDFALIVSSNDAIRSIASVAGAQIAQAETPKTAEEYFIDKMNQVAKEVGLTQTYFLNGSGLDLSGEISGGYGSAQDMAKLFAYILKEEPTLLEATSYSTLPIASSAAVHVAQNTNKIIDSIPGIIASKTGFTDLSGGNLIIAFDAGLMKPVVIAVLGSSIDGRFTDMQTLVNTALKKMAE